MNLIQEYTIYTLQEIRQNLAAELTNAAAGKKNSLAFARHEISSKSSESKTTARIIVIGGSNCVAADGLKTDRGIELSNIHEEPLPVFDNRDTFLPYIAAHIPEDVKLIGLNFAYPMEPVIRAGRLDGRLIKATKEHTFSGVVGHEVGRLIEEHLLETRGQKADVVTANDTICLILSGLKKYHPTGLAGGVIGTGFNFGFFLDKTTLVNLESGNFSSFPVTDSCAAIDEGLEDRGKQLWEKEISGAYLYRHFNFYNKELNLDLPAITSTVELDSLADNDTGTAGNLARELMKRSATFAAVQIAAIFDYLDTDHLNVLIEGSLFWKGWRYRQNLADVLTSLGVMYQQYSIDHIDQSSVLGGALLALGK